MRNKKIKDNRSYNKLKEKLDDARTFSLLSKAIPFIGLQYTEAFSELPKLRNRFEQISNGPDKFNNHFAKKGWIAHESMNADLMINAINLADNGHNAKAEEYLIEYYTSDKLKFHINRLKGIDAFKKRIKLFYLAYEDTKEKKFHSVVPILLMMIDGTVNDITKNTGFFADGTDLTAWDSIAAHSTGLSALRDTFNLGRKKTETNEITLPYRNGILHGRDLGYANITVVAKCWAAVLAIYDWAAAIKQGKKNPPDPQPKLSFKENIANLSKDLRNYSAILERSDLINEVLKEWEPRNIIIGQDIPAKAFSAEYTDNSPEQLAMKFMEYWTKQNYGLIAKQITGLSRTQTNTKKLAGEIRERFTGKVLTNYKIVLVNDTAPSISEISLSISFTYEGKAHDRELILRLFYQSEDCSPLIYRSEEGGTWYIFDDFMYKFDYLYPSYL